MEPALLSLGITPLTPADQQKLTRALQVLAAEDGNLVVRPGAEPECTLIHCTGEAHLDTVVDRLKREFEVAARVSRPAIAYLETLTRTAEGSAKLIRQVHGKREYAHVCLRVHPAEAGAGYSFEDSTIATIPRAFIEAIDAGVRESMTNGPVKGYPVVDVRVDVHDGSYHDVDSTDAAFRTAAAMAFHEAAKEAQPVVLEPIMEAVVTVDNGFLTAVLEGLRKRRGYIHGLDHKPDRDIVNAYVPLSESFGFEGQLHAATHGRGSCVIRYAFYQPVVQGPADDDDYASLVGVPRRPAPSLRTSKVSLPESDDSNSDAPPAVGENGRQG